MKNTGQAIPEKIAELKKLIQDSGMDLHEELEILETKIKSVSKTETA
jgi:hypothetical protein